MRYSYIYNCPSVRWAVVAWWLESWACDLKVAGSILAPAGIEGGDCEWTALSPPSIPWLRCPWARHRTPSCSPGAGAMAAHGSGCVFTVCVCSLLTAVCVHLDGLNAEDQFRVWVTILNNISIFILLLIYTWYISVYNTHFKIVLHTCCCHNKDQFPMFTCFSSHSAPSRCGGTVLKYCSFKYFPAFQK